MLYNAETFKGQICNKSSSYFFFFNYHKHYFQNMKNELALYNVTFNIKYSKTTFIDNRLWFSDKTHIRMQVFTWMMMRRQTPAPTSAGSPYMPVITYTMAWPTVITIPNTEMEHNYSHYIQHSIISYIEINLSNSEGKVQFYFPVNVTWLPSTL